MIKIHSSLAAACVANRLSNQYLIWLLAKHYSGGSGRCCLLHLKKEYCKITGSSDKTFYNHFNRGINKFYHKDKKEIYIMSLKNIFSSLSPVTNFSTCVEIDMIQVLKKGISIQDILVSVVAGSDRFGKPISLNYLAKILNQSRSSVKRHINCEIIKTKRNIIDQRIGWNSYCLVDGRILTNKTEKSFIKSFKIKKQTKIKMNQNSINKKWEIKLLK